MLNARARAHARGGCWDRPVYTEDLGHVSRSHLIMHDFLVFFVVSAQKFGSINLVGLFKTSRVWGKSIDILRRNIFFSVLILPPSSTPLFTDVTC